MRLLLAGGRKVSNGVEALKKRFDSIDVVAISDIDRLKVVLDSGESFDRMLLFEQAITSDGYCMDGNTLRQRMQSIILLLQEHNLMCELICVADGNAALRAMREETFTIKQHCCVAKLSPPYSANLMSALAAKTLISLKEVYGKYEADIDIYQPESSVLWSDEVDGTDDSLIAMEEKDKSTKVESGMVYDVKTGSWVIKQTQRDMESAVENYDKNETDDDGRRTVSAIADTIENKSVKPKRRIFGNRRI